MSWGTLIRSERAVLCPPPATAMGHQPGPFVMVRHNHPAGRRRIARAYSRLLAAVFMRVSALSVFQR